MSAVRQEKYIVPPLKVHVRLKDHAVGIFLSAPSRSALKKAIKKRWVTIDGQLANTATWVTGGESIVLSTPIEPVHQTKLIYPLKVLFEDDHLAVIHKPAGVLVSGNRLVTIANALPQNLNVSTSPDAVTPQPVHRLDYPTTGVLLVGKTQSSIRALMKLFEEKKISKTYMAITIGESSASGHLEYPIDGKPAQSDFKVLQSVSSDRFGQLNLVQLLPKTGRRHQLRRQLHLHGTPILGDQKYHLPELILKGKGLYLHAFELTFIHPFTEQNLCIQSPIPTKFTKIFP